MSGFEIEHVRLHAAVSVELGFAAIERYLRDRHRPLSALCAVELRSPKPVSIDGFAEFNRHYAERLRGWGLVQGDFNAVARSNVAPVVHAPQETKVYGFSVAVPSSSAASTFVVAGSSEWPEGGRFPEEVVRFGDTSPGAIREKARYVLGAMERRMHSLGVTWSQATLIQSYSAYNVFGFLAEDVIPLAGADAGVLVQYCRPPVVGWDYEMDIKGVNRSQLLR